MRSLGVRAGPLVAVADAFLARHPGAPKKLSPDASGLRSLARAIDDWAERDDEPDDDPFIEGAGATLGALLIVILGGEHCAQGGAHRIALGEGFFDPFAAIEAALDDEQGAAGSLSQSFLRARDEAEGRAGIGRARRMLREILTRERPDLRVERGFDRTVTLADGVEIDLTRVLATTEGEDDESVRRAIGKLVGLLPGSRAQDEITDLQERLLPRLVAPGFGAGVGTPLLLRPILGGVLELALVVAYPDRARYLRQGELDAWSMATDHAIEIAVSNLASRSSRARLLRVDVAEGSLVMLRSGDGLDAARLLLPAMHEVLAEQLGTPLLVAIPHRDALWAGAPALRGALAARVQRDAQRAPHRISDALFSLAESGLSVN